MLYAIEEKTGKRIHAKNIKNGETYICPICGERLIPKCGDINVHHFAHVHDSNCDSYFGDYKSEWHIGMQELFPEKYREVIVRHNGAVRVADILCGKYVVEFQHSPMSAVEFDRRNAFYNAAGYTVIWVFDCQNAYLNNQIRFLSCEDEREYSGDYFSGTHREKVTEKRLYNWKNSIKTLSHFVPHKSKKVIVFFQIATGDEDLDLYKFWNNALGCFEYAEMYELERLIWAPENDNGTTLSRFYTKTIATFCQGGKEIDNYYYLYKLETLAKAVMS